MPTVKKLRGGFTPSGFTPRGFGSRFIKPHHVEGAAKYVAGQALRYVIEKPLFKAIEAKARLSGQALKALREGEEVPINKWYSAIKVPSPEGEIVTPKETLGGVIKNTVRMQSRTGVVNTAKTYTTKFVTGEPLARSLKIMKNMFGTQKLVNFDTLVEDQTAGTADRDALLVTTGFNSRKYVGPKSDYYTTYGDIQTLYGLSTASVATVAFQNVYGCMVMKSDKIKIHNSGTVFPSKVKVHYIKAEQTSATEGTYEIFKNSINSNYLAQDQLALPNRYQFNNRTESGQLCYAEFSRRGPGIFGSGEAKSRLEIVKTFSKTLSPGDTWELTEEHYFRSGCNLSALLADLDNNAVSTKNALTYYPIIEFEGVQSEAVYNDGASSTFIGTSPCWLSLEFSKAYEYILEGRDSSNWGGAGVTLGNPAIRLFEKKLTDTDREFHLSMANIGSGAGQYSIPALSETSVVDAGQRT